MDEISLRPMSLRPGGGGAAGHPFSAFSKGAGAKSSQQMAQSSRNQQMRDERKAATGGKTIKYSVEFMLKFAQMNTRCPGVLHQFKGLVLDEDERRSVQQARLAEENNWRPNGAAVRAVASEGQPSTAAPGAQGGGADRPGASAAASESLRIQKASEIGRTAWQPAREMAGSSAKACATLRGILNKVTPDNFDRLVIKVLSIMSVSSDILKACIPLIFEKAVAEPTFCVLYADLCAVLATELSSTDYGQSDGKPITFKRELLNTCQDEFEGMEEQRKHLDDSAPDAEEQRRKLKMRQLGTIRLLAELFNKDLVTQPIMRIVIQELMATSLSNGKYESDLIECIVQAIMLAGATMSHSPKIEKQLKEWLKTLEKWSTDSALEARVRFKIKDLLDQVRAGWVARHETNTVKKTAEIRKQAHAELGMIQATLPAFLQDLPALNPVARPMPKAPEDLDAMYFPGMNEYGMPGLPEPGVPMRPDNPDPAQPSEPEVAKGLLSDADVTAKIKGTFAEFLSIRDMQEAVTCVKELGPSTAQEAIIVQTGIQEMFDAQKASDQAALVGLLIHLHDAGCLSADGVREGIQAVTDGLEDLALDVPLSPQILGQLVGAALAAGIVKASCLELFLEKVESSEPKRHFFKHTMSKLVAELGEDTAQRLCVEGELHAGPLLDAAAEFEPDAPTVPNWAKVEGLSWVPL